MQIEGAVAIVTGAGSGLGEATARHLAALGAKLALLDRSSDAVQAVAKDTGGMAFSVDVSDVTAVEAAVATVVAEQGVPRIAVNCAGIVPGARVLPRDGSLSVDSFEQALRVNLLGTYIVMSAAARAMATAEPCDEDGSRGVVVNTASIASEDGQIGQSAYSASKAGVVGMTLPVARELARSGIRVMAIAPGLFATAMTAGLPDETVAGITANVPFPSRLGQADEYARLVQHIVENPMLNGSVIRLDGAVRMPPK